MIALWQGLLKKKAIIDVTIVQNSAKKRPCH